jgi:hypothetical protein
VVFALLSYSCAVFCFYLFSSVFIGGVYTFSASGSRFVRVSSYFCSLVVHVFPFVIYLFSIKSVISFV